MKYDEIGSEYFFDGNIGDEETSFYQAIDYFAESSINELNSSLSGSGRTALEMAIRSIKSNFGDKNTVLLPGFICESVIDVFAENGFLCSFYDVNLANGIVKHQRFIELLNKTEIILILDYFGFQSNNFNDFINKIIEVNNIIVINDITQSIFSRFPKQKADYYVASLRKWFQLPSGGLLVSRHSVEPTILQNSLFSKKRELAMVSKTQYLLNGTGDKTDFLQLFSHAEQLLEEESHGYLGIDDESKYILNHYCYSSLYKKRRSNYKTLLQEIKNSKSFRIDFDSLDENICPFFFVVRTNRRDELRDYLVNNHVYTPIHWPKPFEVRERNSLDSSNGLYEDLLSIPCDQRYDYVDMLCIANLLNNWGE